MSNSTTVPSRWRYLIGASLIVIALVTCGALATVQIFGLVPDIRFVVPGSHEVSLARSGSYLVFHEYRSVVDDKTYSTGGYPFSMSVRIESASIPQSVEVRSNSGSTSYSTPKYSGSSVMEFSIDQPGTYVFAAEYADSTAGPDIVLAVGQISGLSLLLRLLGLILGSLIIIGVGVFIIVRTLLKRRDVAAKGRQTRPLLPEESDLIGRWVSVRGKMQGDDTTNRIEWLTSSALEKIGPSKEFGGWYILYRDRSDGRYWELSYPEGYRHGGGPPRLTCISEEEAREKYKLS